jgi:hypothetical protein
MKLKLRFELFEDTKTADAGTYPVIRLFDKDRVIVQLTDYGSSPKQTTILRLKKGKLIYG